jgi:hypothetical protein
MQPVQIGMPAAACKAQMKGIELLKIMLVWSQMLIAFPFLVELEERISRVFFFFLFQSFNVPFILHFSFNSLKLLYSILFWHSKLFVFKAFCGIWIAIEYFKMPLIGRHSTQPSFIYSSPGCQALCEATSLQKLFIFSSQKSHLICGTSTS